MCRNKKACETMKQEWEAYWDNYRFPEHFMQSDIEPFGNPVRKLIAGLAEPHDSVLDVGCASCISYPLFKGRKAYIGTDFTLPFLKVAKKNHSSVIVVGGYALRLPFKDGAFDTVFVKDVLEHLGPNTYKTVIAEMWRVAKRQIILAFYGELAPSTIYKQTREPDEHNAGVPPYKGGIYYFNFYGKQDIISTITALPDIHTFEIIENVPLENTSAKCRTVVVVRKK